MMALQYLTMTKYQQKMRQFAFIIDRKLYRAESNQ